MQTENTQESKSQKKSQLIIIILSIALLASWGYMIWDKSEQRQFKQEVEETISDNSTQRDLLQKELADAAQRYDELKTISARKDSTITARDREIIIKKDRIESLLGKVNASKEELAEAKRLISDLNQDIEVFKKEIETLQGEKIRLSSEKAMVTEERDMLSRNLDSAQQVIVDKENMIRLGSTLHASNFSILAIAEKSRGREKSTAKAKKTDKFRITFDLDENRITPSGIQTLYVIIHDPNGRPVIEGTAGSGKFLTHDGVELDYTQKLDLNYIQNKKQTIQFDWRQPTAFRPGKYKIEVYHNGFTIGEGKIPLN